MLEILIFQTLSSLPKSCFLRSACCPCQGRTIVPAIIAVARAICETGLPPHRKDDPPINLSLPSVMADSPSKTPLAADTATLADMPEMLEFVQRLGPVMDLDPDQLPPRLRELLEQDDDVDLSPRELADLLKE